MLIELMAMMLMMVTTCIARPPANSIFIIALVLRCVKSLFLCYAL
jgi:hypothetical protein